MLVNTWSLEQPEDRCLTRMSMVLGPDMVLPRYQQDQTDTICSSISFIIIISLIDQLLVWFRWIQVALLRSPCWWTLDPWSSQKIAALQGCPGPRTRCGASSLPTRPDRHHLFFHYLYHYQIGLINQLLIWFHWIQVALLRAHAGEHLILGAARRSLPYKDCPGPRTRCGASSIRPSRHH